MVEWKNLGEVCKVHTGSQLNRSDMIAFGPYPVINGGREYSGYTDKFNEKANSITISQGGESAGFVNWIDVYFWAGAHCYVVEIPECYDTRYIYHTLKNKERDFQISKQGAGIPGLNRETLYKQIIPIPSLSEQQRIVGILDTFTSSIENLKEQIAQRRKQYEFYRDQLLDLEGKEGVEMKKLGNICKIGDGLHGTPIYDENGDYFFINGNNLSDGKIILKLETKKVDIEMFRKYGVELDEESILMSINGTIGNVAQYRNEKIVLGKSAAYFRIKNKNVLHFKYLYYFLQTTKANEYYNGALTGSTIKNLGLKAIRDFDIPITSLAEQQRIVSILDTFEASIRNLEQQLAQREKQYEYYRNKLLTFE